MDKLSRIVETLLAYDQSEKVEQANSTAIFQNERIIPLKEDTSEKGKPLQNCPQRYLFFSPTTSKITSCVRVQTNYESFPAYFRLGLPTRIFIKLLNVLIFFLRN